MTGGLLPPALAQANWADIEGRIQYAYYTDDARALNSLLTSLRPRPAEAGEGAAPEDRVIRSYFRALAHYRLAQVLSTSRKSQARSAIDDCGDEVDNAIDALPKVPLGLDEPPEARHQRAEAYALDTACTLAGREMSSMPFGGGRIGARIDEALKLEPKNPRVRLVEALAAFDRAGKDAAARAAAVQQLRAVTEMFEAARTEASSTPEWGAAEAYAFLGRALFDQRDLVGAREALERALLIAPDYKFARRVMAQITR
ncbi:MAG TPA: tetratricopeptide repeat protein [Steroidobacteraceae bacterium]|nr:tetratricopeptide repeat protein [Steroidobacteraceae bacterium]